MELAEGVADGDNLLAGGNGLGIAESNGGKVISVLDFEEGNVIQGVGADEFDFFVNCAVVENDLNGVCAIDDVFIGEDVAIGSDDHTGAGGAGREALAEEAGGRGLGDDGDDTRGNFGSNIGD